MILKCCCKLNQDWLIIMSYYHLLVIIYKCWAIFNNFETVKVNWNRNMRKAEILLTKHKFDSQNHQWVLNYFELLWNQMNLKLTFTNVTFVNGKLDISTFLSVYLWVLAKGWYKTTIIAKYLFCVVGKTKKTRWALVLDL